MGSFFVGDILGPMVYRKGLDLNEVTILLALVGSTGYFHFS